MSRNWTSNTDFPLLDPGDSQSGSEVRSGLDTSGNDDLLSRLFRATMMGTELNTWKKVENIVKAQFAIVKNADLRTTDLTMPLSALSLICGHLRKRGKDHAVDMGTYMVTLEIVQTLTKFFGTGLQSVDNYNSLFFNNLILFLKLIANLADTSMEVGESVVSNDLLTILIQMLRAILEEKLTIRPAELAIASFSILCNTIRNSPDSKVKFREAGVVDICKDFLNTEHMLIKILVLLVLTLTADLDRSAEIIQASETNIIQFLIRCLEATLDSLKKRDEQGFSLDELLEGMAKLAMNKTNALEMVRLNVLQHCLTVLDEKKYSVEELKWALKLIWSLSFADENQKAIHASGIVPLLEKKLKYHKNQVIAKPAKSILWELNVKKPNFAPIDPKSDQSTGEGVNEKGHIMISYCWRKEGEKEKAREICRRLKSSGEKVWIDIEKMQGDFLQRMAEAVEKADVVICCFSEDYSQSQPCRQEAEYASKLQKKIVFAKMQADFEPKGWLGLISVGQIYYAFYDEKIFEDQFIAMMKYIKPISDDYVDAPTEPQLATNSEPKRPTFKSWTASEASDWLKKLELTKEATLMLIAKKLVGEELFQLRGWQKTAPEIFLGFCQNTLKIQDPKDLLKFTAAIENLESRGA